MLKELRFDLDTGAGTTDAETAPYGVLGKLCAVKVAIGTLAATSDFTITVTKTPDAVDYTLITLTDISASGVYYPRHQVHSNVGTALTLDGTRIAFDEPLVCGFIKVALAQGGTGKVGKVHCYVEC